MEAARSDSLCGIAEGRELVRVGISLFYQSRLRRPSGPIGCRPSRRRLLVSSRSTDGPLYHLKKVAYVLIDYPINTFG